MPKVSGKKMAATAAGVQLRKRHSRTRSHSNPMARRRATQKTCGLSVQVQCRNRTALLPSEVQWLPACFERSVRFGLLPRVSQYVFPFKTEAQAQQEAHRRGEGTRMASRSSALKTKLKIVNPLSSTNQSVLDNRCHRHLYKLCFV